MRGMEEDTVVPEDVARPTFVCPRQHLIDPRVDVILAGLGDYYTDDYEPAALISGGL